METRLLNFNNNDLSIAGELIRKGELVAFPTETVYGLGANALDEQAVKKTYNVKGRPHDNPEIVHVWSKEQIFEITKNVSDDAKRIIDFFLPGSVTIVLQKNDVISDCVTAGLKTVAIRIPKSKQALEFLKYCAVPISAPSANSSTRPSPTRWQDVLEDMNGKIPAILCGDDCDVGIESTVLDMSGSEPIILRPGVITQSQIEAVLQKSVRVLTNTNEKVNSPGVKYKHYAPNCLMALNLDGDREKVLNFYNSCKQKGYNPIILSQNEKDFGSCNFCHLGKDTNQVGKNVFSILRKLEKTYDYIICSFVPCDEYGQSIVNRLTKSASGNIF